MCGSHAAAAARRGAAIEIVRARRKGCVCKSCTFQDNSPWVRRRRPGIPCLLCGFVSATSLSRAASPSAASGPSSGLGLVSFSIDLVIFNSSRLRQPPHAPGGGGSPMQFWKRYKSMASGIPVSFMDRTGEACFAFQTQLSRTNFRKRYKMFRGKKFERRVSKTSFDSGIRRL